MLMINSRESTLTCIVFLCLISCIGPDPSDSYPVITIPETADTTSPVWKGIDLTPSPPVLAKSVKEQLATFQLPPGYRLEPVLTDPQIQQPAQIAFDPNGRMYVLELRSYMLTADADHELEPTNVISRWKDKDNDGVYEEGTVFVDSLIFPRFVLPWDTNSVLSMESNQDNIYKYTDTDGDGRADTKEFFTGEFGRSGNVEHQQASLFYGMDNWLYSTVNAFRIRWTPGGVIRENTGFNWAQWGITQDDYGKLWFQGGASGVPSYFQFPIYYGTFTVEDQYAEGFKVPWGLPMGLADVQPGMRAVRQPDGSVNEVTGAAGNDLFRGHRLPQALVGQYFYGEPVARIVRQVNPIVTEGITQLHNQYQDFKSEFIRSSDPLFRPVDIATAPDGTMYIVDMYHGIIQEGQWTQPGSYLRAKIEQYQMDKIISLGRIWRLVHEVIPRDTVQPRMGADQPLELLRHLSHHNGWWRDMAQQELVLRQDTVVVPVLDSIARYSENEVGRIHAIWTLEGLDGLDRNLVQELFEDASATIKIIAMRASETLYKSGEESLAADYLKMMVDPDFNVVLQAMMTANILDVQGAKIAIRTAMKRYPQRAIQVVGEEILNPTHRPGFFAIQSEYNDDEKALIQEGARIFQELCATCHGTDGTGVQSAGGLLAPSLVNAPRLNDHPDYMVRVILRGMVGPMDGADFSGGFMTPNAHESDEWIASVTSFLRTNLGNDASVVTPEEVAKIRAESEGDKPYQFEEALTLATRQLAPSEEWRVSASHSGLARVGGTGEPRSAFSYEGWTSGEPQAKDMWFQVQLPEPIQFTEIRFRSPPMWRGWGPDAPPPLPTYPQSYRIEISGDGIDWRNPVQEGDCDQEHSHFMFPPTEGKFLRITQTAVTTEEAPWKMESLQIYGKGIGVM
ncbi:MAG: discoidin domain-containing protein [Saprospiraceae bacterium]|nr:discoidin domain-containing protein [Saprospiraceae bacterium]